MVPVDFLRLSDIVDKDVVKETMYNKLGTKVNSIDGKIPSITGLIHKSQYHTDKLNLKKRLKMLIKTFLTLHI